MKRRCLLGILLCLSMVLCGCTLGDGGSQFTQLDSKYVQSEDDLELKDERQKNQTGSDAEDSEIKGHTAETGKDIEQKSMESEAENSSETVKGKKADKNSIAVDKKESAKKTKSSKTEKEADSDSEAKTSQNRSNKKNTTVSKDSSKKKDTEKKEKDKPSKDTESTSIPKPESEAVENKAFCLVSIDCHTIFSNMSELKSEKKDFVPEDGWILNSTKVTLAEGDTAYDVLYKVCKEYKIHLEAAYTPAYGTYYVEGINQLYEFDCGDLSGWTFLVNGKSINYGCSNYTVKAGDEIQWRFSCNAGRDVKA